MTLEEIRSRAESQKGGMVEMTKAEYGWLLDRISYLEKARCHCRKQKAPPPAKVEELGAKSQKGR